MNADNQLDHEEIRNEICDIKENLAPKAKEFDRFMGCKNDIPMERAAKMLDYKNVGRNILYNILKDKKIISFHTEDDVKVYTVYQAYRKYFRVKATTKDIVPENGDVYTKHFTVLHVRPKGLDWLDKKMSEWGYEQNED
jgi:phage antirepressor YoqD-like protein